MLIRGIKTRLKSLLHRALNTPAAFRMTERTPKSTNLKLPNSSSEGANNLFGYLQSTTGAP